MSAAGQKIRSIEEVPATVLDAIDREKKAPTLVSEDGRVIRVEELKADLTEIAACAASACSNVEDLNYALRRSQNVSPPWGLISVAFATGVALGALLVALLH